MLDCRGAGGQAGASARIENYLGFPTGISGIALMGRAYNQAAKFGVESAIPDEVVGLEVQEADGPAPSGAGVHLSRRQRGRVLPCPLRRWHRPEDPRDIRGQAEVPDLVHVARIRREG